MQFQTPTQFFLNFIVIWKSQIFVNARASPRLDNLLVFSAQTTVTISTKYIQLVKILFILKNLSTFPLFHPSCIGYVWPYLELFLVFAVLFKGTLHPYRCFHLPWLSRPLLKEKLGGAMSELHEVTKLLEPVGKIRIKHRRMRACVGSANNPSSNSAVKNKKNKKNTS